MEPYESEGRNLTEVSRFESHLGLSFFSVLIRLILYISLYFFFLYNTNSIDITL